MGTALAIFIVFNFIIVTGFVDENEKPSIKGFVKAYRKFFDYFTGKKLKKLKDQIVQLKIDHNMALIDEKNKADARIIEIEGKLKLKHSRELNEAYKKEKEKYAKAHENFEKEISRRVSEELLKHRSSVPESRFAQATRKRKEKHLDDYGEELKYNARKQDIRESILEAVDLKQSAKNEIMNTRDERQNLRDEQFENKKKEFELEVRETNLSTEKKKLLVEIAIIELQRKELRQESERARLDLRERAYELRQKMDDFKMNVREWNIEKRESKLEMYEKNLQLLKKEIDQQYQFKLDDIHLREGRLRNEESRINIQREKIAVDRKYNEAITMLREVSLRGKALEFTQIEMDRKIQVIEAIESKWYFNSDMPAIEAYKTAGYYIDNPVVEENRVLEKILQSS